jgi:hypothetical protein
MFDKKISSQSDPRTNQTQTELSASDFSDLLSFLKNIQPHFNDFCLVDGAFRSRTNNLTCVVETGFPYLGKMNFNFGTIKKSANMLSALDKKSKIVITVDNDRVIFADNSQEIQLPISNYEYLDNKYVSDEEMKNIFLEKIDPDRLFLRESMPKTTISNINKMLRELNTISIQVKHVENVLDMVCFQISEGNRGSDVQNYQIKLARPLLLPLKENQYFNIDCMPFEFCNDEISLNFYFTKEENLIHLFYDTVMNNLFVKIYARAALIEESME